jgi:hypothetical protein
MGESRPDAQQTVRLSLGSPADAAKVREQVRLLLAGYGEAVTNTAVQVADELVSHAFRDGQAPREVRLRRLAGGACLRIESTTVRRSPWCSMTSHTLMSWHSGWCASWRPGGAWSGMRHTRRHGPKWSW